MGSRQRSVRDRGAPDLLSAEAVEQRGFEPEEDGPGVRLASLAVPGWAVQGSNPRLTSSHAPLRRAVRWDRADLNRGHGHPRPEGYQATLRSRIPSQDGPAPKDFVATLLAQSGARPQGKPRRATLPRHSRVADALTASFGRPSSSWRPRLARPPAPRSRSPRCSKIGDFRHDERR